jgi:hypothetical protein
MIVFHEFVTAGYIDNTSHIIIAVATAVICNRQADVLVRQTQV